MHNQELSILTNNQFAKTENSTNNKDLLQTKKTESDHVMTNVDSQIIKQQNDYVNSSITQREINSRQIVKYPIQHIGKRKVIKHQINRISPQLQLYKLIRPKNHSNYRYTLANDSQSMKRKQNVKAIYTQLQDKTPAWQKIEKSSQSKNKNYFPKHRKQNSQQNGRLRNISISGLTTYNFHSVKARFRLAYDAQGTEQQVTNTVNNAKKKSYCSISRSEKIHLKTCPNEAPIDRQFNQAVIHNYEDMSTQEYLKYIEVQKQNSKQIYGQRLKWVSKVPEIMNLEQNNQSTAQFTINQIKLSCRPTHQVLFNSNKKAGNRFKLDEDAVFEARRIPIKRSKIIVSNIQLE